MDWRNIPSLSALRAFEATARLSSYSKAARELNVTHAAISQHVRSLEDHFAETLVVRRGRGMAVTPKGAALADSLKTGFLTISDGVENLRRQSENRPLSISLTPAFASNWLMPRIGDFWAKHPDITVNLNPSIHLVDLAQDGVDMAIRFGRGHWQGLHAEPLTSGDYVVVVRPDLIKGRNFNCLQDLPDIPWLFENSMTERKALIENEGLDLDAAKVSMLNTNELVLSALRAGLGMSSQPYALVEKEIEAGNLAKICSLKDDGLGYYMVTRKSRTTPALLQFQKWLQQAAKN
jgi:LysR family transcriptional regulator, glycine cleavage system transcriptional activator